MKLKFPENFYWGTATSAHQVEGDNHNDWSEWEHLNSARLVAEAVKRHVNTPTRIPDFILNDYPSPLQEENYISGKACDHYNRFREDFDIAKSLNHNAHRFSIEWSRIEPKEGKFNEREIEHYREVIRNLRERGLEPFVSLWHWTIPLWVRDFGGPESKKFVYYFTRFSRFVVSELKDEVKFWMTLNEPTSVIANSYFLGIWPPQKKNIFPALRVFKNLANAHKASYKAIRKISPNSQVGFGNILLYVEPYGKNPLDKSAAYFRDFWSNKYFLKLVGNTYDFLALQYYFHFKIKFPQKTKNDNQEMSDLGWEIYPEGIYHLLKRLKKYKKPIFITENGLADAQDIQRGKFIKEHLKWIHKAIEEGTDVRGYFYWSLLDNFEWDKGFWPRFGLVEVDYETLKRKIRPSAFEYAKICKENALELES